MTKKHFVDLADFIRDNPKDFSGHTIECLAYWLERQNPKFNRKKWLDYINRK